MAQCKPIKVAKAVGRHLANHIYLYEAAIINSVVVVSLVPWTSFIPAPGRTMNFCQWIAIYVELLVLSLAIIAYATIAQVKADRERNSKAAAAAKIEPMQPKRGYTTTFTVAEVEEKEEA